MRYATFVIARIVLGCSLMLAALAWFHVLLPRAVSVQSSWMYDFGGESVLSEAPSPDASASADWWLDSGGLFFMHDGIGSTIQGDLPADNPWYARYGASASADTDGGAHPQNLFRLVSRHAWGDVRVTLRARITGYHASVSPNRNSSNGIFIMSMYMDGDNLYYLGVRVDGRAVIKKKQGGTYTTLAGAPLFAGAHYRANAPNLLPEHQWLTLVSETARMSDGVHLRLFFGEGTDTPQLVLEAADASGFAAPNGRIGIRTDFLDAEFDSMHAEAL